MRLLFTFYLRGIFFLRRNSKSFERDYFHGRFQDVRLEAPQVGRFLSLQKSVGYRALEFGPANIFFPKHKLTWQRRASFPPELASFSRSFLFLRPFLFAFRRAAIRDFFCPPPHSFVLKTTKLPFFPEFRFPCGFQSIDFCARCFIWLGA